MKILIIDDEDKVAARMRDILIKLIPNVQVTICTTQVMKNPYRIRMPEIDVVEGLIVEHDLILIDHSMGNVGYNGRKLRLICEQTGKRFIGISTHHDFCQVNFMAKHQFDEHPMFVKAFEDIVLGELLHIATSRR